MAITQGTGSRLLGLFATALAMGVIGAAGPGYAQIEPQADSYGSLIQPNDQGNSVAELQQRLANLGYYDGPVTGYFDTSTQAAVRQFQQANGLADDGIVGAATSSALSQGSSSPDAGSTVGGTAEATGTLQIYDSGSQVSALQQQLSQLGYYSGSVTGVFDDATQAAVINFQRSRGLAVDGIAGSATLTALAQPASTPTSPVAPTYTPATPNDGLLQLGDTGSEVSDLQSRLQTLGYYDGPISGSFGSQTQTALIAFQQAQGITADGIAGPQVTAALGGVSAPSVATGVAPAISPTVPTSPAVPTVQPTIQPAQPAIAPAAAVAPSAVPTVAPAVPGTVMPTSPASALGAPAASVQVPSLPPLPPADPSMAQAPVPQSGQPTPQGPLSRQSSPPGERFGVSELQRRLQMRGFDPGQASGVYDSATQEAITKAQEAYGISGQDLRR